MAKCGLYFLSASPIIIRFLITGDKFVAVFIFRHCPRYLALRGDTVEFCSCTASDYPAIISTAIPHCSIKQTFSRVVVSHIYVVLLKFL